MIPFYKYTCIEIQCQQKTKKVNHHTEVQFHNGTILLTIYIIIGYNLYNTNVCRDTFLSSIRYTPFFSIKITLMINNREVRNYEYPK